MITDVATPAPTTPARHRTRPEPQVRRPLIDYAMALTPELANRSYPYLARILQDRRGSARMFEVPVIIGHVGPLLSGPREPRGAGGRR